MASSRSSARVGPDWVLLAVAISAVAFLAGALLPAIRVLYAPLCHQIEERSLHVAGTAMAVCARCSGAYAGGAAGLLIAALWGARLRRGKLFWLALAALPSLLDVGAHLWGYSGVGTVARALLALPAGYAAGLLLAEGIEDLKSLRQQRRSAWSAATAGEGSR